MSKLNFRKPAVLAMSLAFASATILATAASAGTGGPRDPACDARVAAACASNWQTLGYPNQQTCEWGQPCMECPPLPGYMCGGPGIYYSTEKKTTRPW